MPHNDTRTFAVSFTASSNSTGTAEILELPEGGPFIVQRVSIFGESGASGAIELQVFEGESPVVPEQGTIALTPNYHPLPVNTELGVGDVVEARWQNTGGTDREVTVAVTGEYVNR